MTGPGGASSGEHGQPYLLELSCAVRAPAMALSERDGQIDAHAGSAGAAGCGLFVEDLRILSRLVVEIDGARPVGVGVESTDDGTVFIGIVRGAGDSGPDPTVYVRRVRTLSGRGLRESITVQSRARARLGATLAVLAGTDAAPMSAVKQGASRAPIAPEISGRSLSWSLTGGDRVDVEFDSEPDRFDEEGRFEYAVDLAPGESMTLTVDVVRAPGPVGSIVLPAGTARPVLGLRAHADDRRLGPLVDQSMRDLDALLLRDPLGPDDHFTAAGAPWYLTLFGRDSLWTARMLTSVTPELAGGTLRVLARRQGRSTVTETAEEPGKILHEVRPDEADYGGSRDGLGLRLPPVYYGTVDATPLWVNLLHDAWRWGLPEPQVAPLLEPMERALAWVEHRADLGNGFLHYIDQTGHGLSNQGWKDSFDSIQFRDGRLAEGPISLCEVQAYAYAAARQGADLLEAFGRPGADRWRDFAAELKLRFRERFWLTDARGPYPAIALDGSGRPVDTVTSNIGHLLGSGLLDDEESSFVVARLGAGDLDSELGLRTLSSDSTGFNPFAYHGGSVWSHDTAIAIRGLCATGTPQAQAVAASLITGLISAGGAFESRLPELYAVLPGAQRPTAYPASCRPQAWAAAAAGVVIEALLGLDADVPAGVVRLRPLLPSPVGALRVDGLRVGPARLSVGVSSGGEIEVDGDLAGLRLETP